MTIYISLLSGKAQADMKASVEAEIISVEDNQYFYANGNTISEAIDKLAKRFEHDTGDIFPNHYDLTTIL